MIPADVRCATCAYWRRDLPAVTTAWRRPEGADRELGTCTFRAPVVLAIAGVPVSLQPETRSNRSCEDWSWERNEGEDLADGNVINLDDRRPQA